MNKRKEIATQHSGILKILVLNKSNEWVEPKNGKKFKASRFNSDGKRIKRNFDSIAEAKAFRSGNDSEEKNLSALLVHRSLKMTFGTLLELWITNWLPSINIATQLRYKQYLKHFAFFSNMAVADIQPAHIDAWIAFLKRPEYLALCHSTRCSYEHEYKVLRAILRYYSSRCDRSYQLPFLREHTKMLKVKEKPLVKKDLSIGQLQTFFQELKLLCWGTSSEAIYYLALLQYATYSRIQEAAALHVEDFDLVNNRIEVKRKVQWFKDKAYNDQVVSGSKSNGGKVFSPIPQLAASAFKEWMLRSGVRSGLLLQIDGKIIRYRQIQYFYNRALKNAELPFTATHILRHASLVEAYSSTKNILVVQQLAGHASLKATEKYAKARDDQMTEVQNRMDEKLSPILK